MRKFKLTHYLARPVIRGALAKKSGAEKKITDAPEALREPVRLPVQAMLR